LDIGTYVVLMTTAQSPCDISWEGMHDHFCGLVREHDGPHVCLCGDRKD